MRGQLGGLFALTCAALVWAGALSADPCRQALAIGLDVSGSVDAKEYRLQLDGLAGALLDEEVKAALLTTPQIPVTISVFEWSSSTYQRVILPWTPITDEAAINDIVLRLQTWRRIQAPQTTGLGAALQFGAALLDQRSHCTKRTLDVSGDGTNNDWPRPQDVIAKGVFGEATVNGLVIGQELPKSVTSGNVGIAELSAYFRANVISGPEAFVEVALGFQDYQAAMTRKLLREIATFALGRLILDDL